VEDEGRRVPNPGAWRRIGAWEPQARAPQISLSPAHEWMRASFLVPSRSESLGTHGAAPTPLRKPNWIEIQPCRADV
jgi:hypothetical protein